jgi:hypothetical protein
MLTILVLPASGVATLLNPQVTFDRVRRGRPYPDDRRY